MALIVAIPKSNMMPASEYTVRKRNAHTMVVCAGKYHIDLALYFQTLSRVFVD